MQVLQAPPLYDAEKGLPIPAESARPVILGIEVEFMGLVLKGSLPYEADAPSLLQSFLAKMFEAETVRALDGASVPMAVLCVDEVTDDADLLREVLDASVYREGGTGGRVVKPTRVVTLAPPLESCVWCLVGRPVG
ncbi:MAG: hypothetical protein ACYTFG_01850 [Planctomycetota bacterium]|jgi:hypothetical protein